MEPGIRDTCEWARLVSEERVGAAGKVLGQGWGAPSPGPGPVPPLHGTRTPDPPPLSFLFSSDLGFLRSPGTLHRRGAGACGLQHSRPWLFRQGWNMAVALLGRVRGLCPWVLVPDCLSSNPPIPTWSYLTSLGLDFLIHKMR